MTALPAERVPAGGVQRQITGFYIEMFQRRPYPLDVSGWFARGVAVMLQQMAGSVGVRFPAVSELVVERDGVVVSLALVRPRPTARTLLAPLNVVRRARRFPVQRWTEDPRWTRYGAEMARLRSLDLSAMSWGQVIGAVSEVFRGLRLMIDLRVDHLPAAFLPQLPMRGLLLVLGRRALIAPLLAGAPTRTRQANDALEEIADQVRADPALRTAVDALTPAQVRDRLAEPGFAALRSALDDFLAEYGHRETVSVVLSSAPTWSEAPEVVLGIVKALVTGPSGAAEDMADARSELLQHPALRFAPLRRAALAAVEAAGRGLAFREDSHFGMTLALPPLRRLLLELGGRLVEIGVLADPQDIFHMRLEELEAIPDVRHLSDRERGTLTELVRERARVRASLGDTPLLELADLSPGGDPGDALVRGIGASRGVHSGPVRVLHGPEEFGLFRSGDVLVCPYTNPSWTPLFPRAAAVVVDTGGLASHAAIVAREYGVPAVMGTRNGTQVLHDGQLVRVDGVAGTVVLVAAAPRNVITTAATEHQHRQEPPA